MHYLDYEVSRDRRIFADPGGRSALRSASKRNPRNLPCPTCKAPNRLTPADKARGYQCDSCADKTEGGGVTGGCMAKVAYVVVPGNKPGERIGLVKYRESGYYATSMDNPTLTIEQVQETASSLNRGISVPDEVAESMLFGSLFGWHTPSAQRAILYFG